MLTYFKCQIICRYAYHADHIEVFTYSSVVNKQLLNSTFAVSEDVFVLKNKDGKNPEIFGLFSTTRWVEDGTSISL